MLPAHKFRIHKIKINLFFMYFIWVEIKGKKNTYHPSCKTAIQIVIEQHEEEWPKIFWPKRPRENDQALSFFLILHISNYTAR